MPDRSDFVKNELTEIYNILNNSYEYTNLSKLENQDRFIKVFDILMEIRNKAQILNNLLKGNYFFI